MPSTALKAGCTLTPMLAVVAVVAVEHSILTTCSTSLLAGKSGPFSEEPKLTLGNQQILKYDGGMGQWRNTDMIDGGSY